MKIKVNKVIQEEVEIKLPYYAESGNIKFKVISDNNYISVSEIPGHPSFHTFSSSNPFSAIDTMNEITEEEFNAARDRVIEQLKSF